jgi:hypothetical protein
MVDIDSVTPGGALFFSIRYSLFAIRSANGSSE